MTISKNTKVRLLTTNGGDTVATLTHNYKPTYSITLLTPHGSYFTVSPDRIKSITPIVEGA